MRIPFSDLIHCILFTIDGAFRNTDKRYLLLFSTKLLSLITLLYIISYPFMLNIITFSYLKCNRVKVYSLILSS